MRVHRQLYVCLCLYSVWFSGISFGSADSESSATTSTSAETETDSSRVPTTVWQPGAASRDAILQEAGLTEEDLQAYESELFRFWSKQTYTAISEAYLFAEYLQDTLLPIVWSSSLFMTQDSLEKLESFQKSKSLIRTEFETTFFKTAEQIVFMQQKKERVNLWKTYKMLVLKIFSKSMLAASIYQSVSSSAVSSPTLCKQSQLFEAILQSLKVSKVDLDFINQHGFQA